MVREPGSLGNCWHLVQYDGTPEFTGEAGERMLRDKEGPDHRTKRRTYTIPRKMGRLEKSK